MESNRAVVVGAVLDSFVLPQAKPVEPVSDWSRHVTFWLRPHGRSRSTNAVAVSERGLVRLAPEHIHRPSSTHLALDSNTHVLWPRVRWDAVGVVLTIPADGSVVQGNRMFDIRVFPAVEMPVVSSSRLDGVRSALRNGDWETVLSQLRDTSVLTALFDDEESWSGVAEALEKYPIPYFAPQVGGIAMRVRDAANSHGDQRTLAVAKLRRSVRDLLDRDPYPAPAWLDDPPADETSFSFAVAADLQFHEDRGPRFG